MGVFLLGRVHHSLKHLQEEFVHGHAATGLDAVEGGEGAAGRLPQQGQCEEKAPGALGVLGPPLALQLQQRLVQQVAQLLHRLHILNVHRVCQEKEEDISKRKKKKVDISMLVYN